MIIPEIATGTKIECTGQIVRIYREGDSSESFMIVATTPVRALRMFKRQLQKMQESAENYKYYVDPVVKALNVSRELVPVG